MTSEAQLADFDKDLGQLDVLLINAGMFDPLTRIDDLTRSEWFSVHRSRGRIHPRYNDQICGNGFAQNAIFEWAGVECCLRAEGHLQCAYRIFKGEYCRNPEATPLTMDVADMVKGDFSVAELPFATTVQNDSDHGPSYSACRGVNVRESSGTEPRPPNRPEPPEPKTTARKPRAGGATG